ncbi:hypothetical protein [Nonomuraea guangzhouensis]|uniref:Uncharacterized protein n=1 Tax=Nonomuraea guangzhouensis TaxID=1291555 RepID=A0ABW4GGE2_9ACTN|nr:hypothetical protein [Nonomuraea guangzhouensis]
MPVIEVDGGVKRYRDVTAVDDVSLQVQPGQVYALLRLKAVMARTASRNAT